MYLLIDEYQNLIDHGKEIFYPKEENGNLAKTLEV
jgi:hypothetical protein